MKSYHKDGTLPSQRIDFKYLFQRAKNGEEVFDGKPWNLVTICKKCDRQILCFYNQQDPNMSEFFCNSTTDFNQEGCRFRIKQAEFVRMSESEISGRFYTRIATKEMDKMVEEGIYSIREQSNGVMRYLANVRVSDELLPGYFKKIIHDRRKAIK